MNDATRRAYRGPVKAVILDWAGTAVDYGSFAPTVVFLRLFEREGVKITAEDARSGMGLMKKDHLRAILARPSVAAAWHAAHNVPAVDEDVERLFGSFQTMQLAVLQEFARPIPGMLDVQQELRERGIKIGSTTGYLRSMMDVLVPAAMEYGYDPDCVVCPDETAAGRPFPWMCYLNAIRLGVYPMQAMVKVGDTLVDMEEGVNAGMWTVGLSQTGNLMGLSEAEVAAMPAEERLAANRRIANQLYAAGAHLVIDGIWDLPAALAEIEDRLKG